MDCLPLHYVCTVSDRDWHISLTSFIETERKKSIPYDATQVCLKTKFSSCHDFNCFFKIAFWLLTSLQERMKIRLIMRSTVYGIIVNIWHNALRHVVCKQLFLHTMQQVRKTEKKVLIFFYKNVTQSSHFLLHSPETHKWYSKPTGVKWI
jgi:hypothetical protein